MRRRMMMNKTNNILPPQYQRVAYISTTNEKEGGQYIDTEYMPNHKTKILLEVGFSAYDKKTRNICSLGSGFGINLNGGSWCYVYRFGRTQGAFSTIEATKTNDFDVVELSKDGCFINGLLGGTDINTEDWELSRLLCLMAHNPTAPPPQTLIMQLLA